MKKIDNRKLKIALVGLGASGSVIARLFQRDKQTKEITCFARDLKKAKEFLPDGMRKIRLKKIDAEKEKSRFTREISGVDLVINAASSKINLKIMDACLQAGANYLDLASHHLHSPFKAEQLEFDAKFKKRGLKGLICAGVAPGISNLLIRELAGQFDAVTSIKLRLAEHIVSRDIISSWSPEIAVEELSQNVPVYENGRFSLRPPFSEEEIYGYPPPFGKMSVTLICQDEQLTIPLFVKTKNMNVKSGGGDIEPMKLLYKLGMFSRKPIGTGKNRITARTLLEKIIPPTPSPKEMLSIIKKDRIQEARFGIVVEIKGKKKNHVLTKKKWLIFPSIFRISKLMPGATYISYPTGLAAYLFAKNPGAAAFTGVIPPEGLEPKIGNRVLKSLKYGF